MEKKFINFQDTDGEIAVAIERLMSAYKKAHPTVNFSKSAAIRTAILAGVPVAERELSPRLEDKQRTGKLRKA